MHMRLHSRRRGFTALETAIGVSLVALVLTFVMTTVAQFINTGRTTTQKTQALYLAEETLELVRFVRDVSWTNISSLTNGTTYYIRVASGAVSVTTTPQIAAGFTRSFVISNVYRNATTDDIVASTTGGSVADTSTKYVTARVVGGNPTSTVSLTTIIADLDP